jgi:predicted acetylornithine/succinylornithine family transaminase
MYTEEIKSLTQKYIMNSYGARSLTLEKGEGVYVWDTDGKKYLDFVAGIAVNQIGHCHPALIKAVEKQLHTLIHVSNLYYIEPQARLAQMLCELSFADKSFFCNSGAEANEGAIKLARKYGHLHYGPDKFEIITMLHSFHGRTYAAITATGQEKYQKGFEPLVPGFHYAELNNLDSVKALVSDKTCAIMVEPVQGESGVHPCTPEFLKGLRGLCDKYNALLIFDEVQCGLGRTGKMFAYEQYGIAPDIMTLAKGIAGGLPMGAVLTTDKVAEAFTPGSHASTFGGNPLCSAAACATIEIIQKDNLLKNAEEMGNYLITGLKKIQAKFPMITEVRGMGLIIGAQLDRPGSEIVKQCIDTGLLINCANQTTLRFVPPLIVTKKDIDNALAILETVLTKTP